MDRQINNLNFLDKILLYISPKKFCDRASWRLEALRYYDAARLDRFGNNWIAPDKLSVENTDGPYRNLIRARARDLERNNGIVQGVLESLIRNVIGSGIMPQPEIVSNSGKLLENLNSQIKNLWLEWQEKNFCDISGNFSFSEFQELYLRRLIIDGDIFIILCNNFNIKNNKFNFCLQAIEPDLLAEDLTEYNNNKVFGGIEVDDFMRPIAYHFRLNNFNNFNNFYNYKITRIPAERVIHGFKKIRPQQIRGVSSLAGSMEAIRDLGEYIDSELKAARIAGSMTGIIKTENGAQQIGRLKNKLPDGTPLENIQVGMLNYLKPGEDIEFNQPGRPNAAAGDFISVITRFIGVGLGLSYEAVSRDLSQVNYSSIREGRLQDIKTYETLQRDIIKTLCQPVYNFWLENIILNKLIKLPEYFINYKNNYKYKKARWVRPGWAWVDPQKEANAAEKSLNLGTATLQEICGYEGKDWKEILTQRKSEQDFIKSIGLENNLNISNII